MLGLLAWTWCNGALSIPRSLRGLLLSSMNQVTQHGPYAPYGASRLHPCATTLCRVYILHSYEILGILEKDETVASLRNLSTAAEEQQVDVRVVAFYRNKESGWLYYYGATQALDILASVSPAALFVEKADPLERLPSYTRITSLKMRHFAKEFIVQSSFTGSFFLSFVSEIYNESRPALLFALLCPETAGECRVGRFFSTLGQSALCGDMNKFATSR
jgi:hypothetical protein